MKEPPPNRVFGSRKLKEVQILKPQIKQIPGKVVDGIFYTERKISMDKDLLEKL